MESCKCPITQEIFEDPVIGDDGHTYERKAITDWLKKNGTSPITRQPMDINTLRTNYIVKQMIEEMRTASRLQTAQYRFQLDVDIRKTRQKPIFQGFGKFIYEVEWISRDGPPIILLKIGGAKANREASFYVQLSCHPYIVRTFGFVECNPDSIMLLQECAPHGDLSELLQENRFKPNERVLCRIFEQICDAMICLADNGIVHGDLACRNVLVFQYDKTDPDRNLVKLTDFGLTRGSELYSVVDSSARSTMTIIPIRYAAPEILRDPSKLNYSEKSDIYSMSVFMWEACSYGQLPYSSLHNDNDVQQRKLNDQRLPQPSLCSHQLWNILNDCWQSDPNNRPTFQTLKKSLLTVQSQSSCNPQQYKGQQLNQDRINVHPAPYDIVYIENNSTSLDYNRLSAYNTKDNYISYYGQKCTNKTDLDQHKLTDCKTRSIPCSLCQEPQPSSIALRDHLMTCGNKTDQCPNCRKFVRRAVFSYHYDNNCANLEETDTPTPRPRSASLHRRSSKSNTPSLRENDTNDHDQENNSTSQSSNHRTKTSERISSATSTKRNSLNTTECIYCDNQCAFSDYEAHQDNCLKNPKNLIKTREQTSTISKKTESGSLRDESRRSPDIVYIPCEICNEQIDLRYWSAHVQNCREQEIRRIETRAETINREPVTEKFPCEHCEELVSVKQLQAHEIVCRKNPEYIPRIARHTNRSPLGTLDHSNKSSKPDRDPTLSSTYSSLPSSSSISAYNRPSRSRDILDRINDREHSATLQDERFSSHLSVDIERAQEILKTHNNDALTFANNGHEPSKQRRTSVELDSQLINSSRDVLPYDTLASLSNTRKAMNPLMVRNPDISQSSHQEHHMHQPSLNQHVRTATRNKKSKSSLLQPPTKFGVKKT